MTMTEQHDSGIVGDRAVGATPTTSETTSETTTDAPGTEAPGTEPTDTEAPEAGSTESEPTEFDTDSDSDSVESESVESESGEGSGRRRQAKTADLEREGEVAADFLETLLDIADLDGDIDVDVDGDRAAVSIVDSEEGRVPRRLVGPDGKVLDALQELTRLAVQSATGERSRLMLDVAGHRAERRAALVTIAQKVIAEVRATGEKASLEPMTAFERKVVHDEVLAAGLTSESDGVEPRRFVVVLPG
jgi:spoIIIJ-associated protein